MFSTRVYEVDERNATFLVHQGSDLYSLKKTRVPLGSLGSGPESALRYMIVEVDPMVMKKNILFKSPILLINKCRHHVQVHFSRDEKRIYTMQIVEDNILPVPVDLLDCLVDFDVANVAKKAEVRVPATSLWAAPTETVQAYSSNEIFSLSLFTDADEDCKYLYISPPLVIKKHVPAEPERPGVPSRDGQRVLGHLRVDSGPRQHRGLQYCISRADEDKV